MAETTATNRGWRPVQRAVADPSNKIVAAPGRPQKPDGNGPHWPDPEFAFAARAAALVREGLIDQRPELQMVVDASGGNQLGQVHDD